LQGRQKESLSRASLTHFPISLGEMQRSLPVLFAFWEISVIYGVVFGGKHEIQ